ncbi:MAG: phosphoribosylamine--glycine ligase [Bacteroidales bacterium]|nr:phosphoribosylamine--glycine ligase [Bacteroidales bacterium]
MNKKNILLLGSGGREHAMAWKMAQSPLLGKLFIAPGNAGTREVGTNVSLGINDFPAIRGFVLENQIDMIVVGPEEPLVKGIADYFRNDPYTAHIHVVGPGKAGAQLEGSKDFAKAFMQKHGIPTAAYQSFTRDTLNKAYEFLDTLKPPYVLKADGLAAGKGVIICNEIATAREELEMMLNGRFGDASATVVIEEFLQGIELSVFFLTDGKTALLLPEAKDYKRIGEGDSGPNTGGMGSISPVPFADEDFMKKVMDRIVDPTIRGLQKDGIPYSGFVFAGLMNVSGDPVVIEYNVRMGDPESESVFPRIKSDLVEVFFNLSEGRLAETQIEADARTAACVMMVSAGYPNDYEKGKEISLKDGIENSLLFHAGTKFDEQSGKVVTSGGRVLAVTSLADTKAEALKLTYESLQKISFEGNNFRRDIGFDL